MRPSLGTAVVCAVRIGIDHTTGKALGIQRPQKQLNEHVRYNPFAETNFRVRNYENDRCMVP